MTGLEIENSPLQGLSQDLETGCPKLATVNVLGVHFYKRCLDALLAKTGPLFHKKSIIM